MHSHSWSLPLIVIELLKLFGIIPGAAAAFGMQRFYQKWRQKKAMEGWPATDATIRSGRTRKESFRSHWAEITYTYYVGEYRSGKYVRRFRHADEAAGFVREVKDKRVLVHYDPSNPDRSVVLDRDLEMIAMLVPQFR